MTKPLVIDVAAQGNLLRSHSEGFENLPVESEVTHTCEAAVFRERFLLGQCFVTIQDQDGLGGGVGACREYALLRDDNSFPAGFSKDTRRCAQYVKSESRINWNNMELEFK